MISVEKYVFLLYAVDSLVMLAGTTHEIVSDLLFFGNSKVSNLIVAAGFLYTIWYYDGESL